MPGLTRRQFLIGAAATAAAGAAVPVLASDTEVTPERHEIVVPDLDPAHDGLRVAQLSDLHVGELTPVERIRAAVEEANRFRPDLVVLTGDYLTRDPGGVTLMREQLGGLEAPTLATLGNHDRRVDPRGAWTALEHLGYGVLMNENTTLTLRGAPFTVVGIYKMAGTVFQPILYMNFEYLSTTRNEAGQAYSIRVVTDAHDCAAQEPTWKRGPGKRRRSFGVCARDGRSIPPSPGTEEPQSARVQDRRAFPP